MRPTATTPTAIATPADTRRHPTTERPLDRALPIPMTTKAIDLHGPRRPQARSKVMNGRDLCHRGRQKHRRTRRARFRKADGPQCATENRVAGDRHIQRSPTARRGGLVRFPAPIASVHHRNASSPSLLPSIFDATNHTSMPFAASHRPQNPYETPTKPL